MPRVSSRPMFLERAEARREFPTFHARTVRALNLSLGDPKKPHSLQSGNEAEVEPGPSFTYLWVALVRASSSRCPADSVIETEPGPLNGLGFTASRTGASTLSRPSGLDAM